VKSPSLANAGIPEQEMVVATPYAVFELAIGAVQFALDAPHIIRLSSPRSPLFASSARPATR